MYSIHSTASELSFVEYLRSDRPDVFAGYVAALPKRKFWGDVDGDVVADFCRENPPAAPYDPATARRYVKRWAR